MTSARTSGAVSGAAQGAAIGSMFGPVGIAIGGGAGLLGGWLTGSSMDAQHANQTAWAQYNNAMEHKTNLMNIQMGMTIGMFNYMMGMRDAQADARDIRAAAAYNANIIKSTVDYNTSLLQAEEEQVWEDADLAVDQIEIFRERERGDIIAMQSTSGTVIGEGSNAGTIIDQMTQEALDVFVVMHDAERQAAVISNSISRGIWEGQVAINKTIWEGEMQAYQVVRRAATAGAGQLATTALNSAAALYTSQQGAYMGNIAIAMEQDRFSAQNQQDMLAGLFQAGGTAVSVYYANKVPRSQPIPNYTPARPGGSDSVKGPPVTNYTQSPGTSLLTGQTHHF